MLRGTGKAFHRHGAQAPTQDGNRTMPVRPIRIIIYGLGTMGRLSAAYAHGKGAEIVAVYLRTTTGKDFSAPELASAAICTPEVPFETHQADVILVTHGTTIAQLHEPAARAARAGLDVLTIAEDASEPFYPDAEAAQCRELDALFRVHGKSMISVGVQDSFWYAQPMAFLSCAQNVRRLIGRNTCDLSLFGTAGTHGHGIGLAIDELPVIAGKTDWLQLIVIFEGQVITGSVKSCMVIV